MKPENFPRVSLLQYNSFREYSGMHLKLAPKVRVSAQTVNTVMRKFAPNLSKQVESTVRDDMLRVKLGSE